MEVDDSEYLDFLADEEEDAPIGVDPSLVYPPDEEGEVVAILPVIENPEDVSTLLKIDVNIPIAEQEEIAQEKKDENSSEIL